AYATGAPPAPLPITQTSKSGNGSPGTVLFRNRREVALAGRRVFLVGVDDAAADGQLVDREAPALGRVAFLLGGGVARDHDGEVVVRADRRRRVSAGLVIDPQDRLV